MFEPVVRVINGFANKLDIDGFNWPRVIVIALVTNDLFELVLDYRQFIALRNDTIPPLLKEVVDKEQLEKSRKYDRAKLNYKNWHRVFKLIINTAWYYYGMFAWEWDLTTSLVSKLGLRWFSGEIAKSIVFAHIANTISSILELPSDLYFQFVLEEQFGFNKSTLGLFVSDFFKKQVIGLLLNTLTFAGLGYVVDYFGDLFFIYASLFILVFILVFQVVYPVFIDPWFNKFEPLPDGELRTAIDNLAKGLNFPLTHIYVKDSSKRSAHSNAYFIGLPWYKQIVLFDTLIESTTTEEVVAILGHELGHWKLNHIPKQLSLNMGLIVTLFVSFSCFINNNSLYASLGIPQPHWAVGLFVFTDLFVVVQAPIKFALTALTRKHEYEADEFSTNLGHGRQLIRGLIAIAKGNLSTLHADPLYAAYRHSHPILPTRLDAIEKYIAVYEAKHK